MKELEKSLSFLNIMVRVVFISTFIFTIAVGIVAYIKDWEMVMMTLTERWFTVMVGELIVTGAIQIAKEVVGGLMRIKEAEADPYNKQFYSDPVVDYVEEDIFERGD